MQVALFFGLLRRSFWRDRAAVVWTFGFPLFLLAALGGLFSGAPERFASLAVEDADDGPVGRELRARVRQSGWLAGSEEDPDATLSIPAGTSERVAAGRPTRLVLRLAGDDAERQLAVHALVSAALLQLNQSLAPGAIPLELAPPARPPVAAAARSPSYAAARSASYADFLLWGLVGLNVLSTALFGVGVGGAWFREEGVLRRLWLSPARPRDFLLAQLLHIGLVLVASTSLLVATGHLVFGTPRPPALGFAVVLVAGAFALVPVGLAIAGRTGRPQTTQMVANLLYFPLMLLSGVYFRAEAIDEGVAAVMAWLPLKPFLDTLRAVAEGAPLSAHGAELGLLVAYGIAGCALARGGFRWHA